MITTKRDDPWMMLSVGRNRNERLAHQVITNRGKCRSMEEFLVAVFNLLNSEFVVVGCNRNITAVDNLEAGHERVDFEGYIVAAIQSQST